MQLLGRLRMESLGWIGWIMGRGCTMRLLQGLRGWIRLAMNSLWVSTYNYAENDPAGSIDLWGLQKVKMSEIRTNFHAGVTAGKTGFEVKAIGTKFGMSVATGSTDLLGVNIDYNDIEGKTISSSVLLSSPEEEWGISGGELLGGELSTSLNTESGETTFSTVTNVGLFYIKDEVTKSKEGKGRAQYVGFEIGGSAGIIFGVDISASIEFKLFSGINSEGAKHEPTEQATVEAVDNTRTKIPLINELENNY